jgi:hypothetical protein
VSQHGFEEVLAPNHYFMVKKLKSVHNNTIIEREKDYGQRLQSSSIAGDVELFT